VVAWEKILCHGTLKTQSCQAFVRFAPSNPPSTDALLVRFRGTLSGLAVGRRGLYH
jgi:hypothetical protein